jgi:FkbM family methyltransferase
MARPADSRITPALRRVTLPDGVAVWTPSPFEALVLYREIVAERTYEGHGITLDEGAVVFDVGANIGLYAAHLARTIPGVRVHTFEPIPALFEALTRNLAEHAPAAVARNVGLADRAGEAVFELDRFSTIASTMHPDVFERGASRTASPATWASAGLADLDRVTPQRWIGVMRRALATPVVRSAALAVLAPVALALRLRKRLFLQRTRCPLQTLSQALAESGAARVDLVKIDVEGAEEQVLGGIADEDWGRLRQFVIEVHDVDGRLDRMAALLERRGYRTVRAREDWAIHELLSISTLYAARPR